MPRERQQQQQSIACQQCAAERRTQAVPGRNQPRTLEASNIARRDNFNESVTLPPEAAEGFEPAE